jgi:hypothetical protein
MDVPTFSENDMFIAYHENDSQNRRKWAKMERRQAAGKLNLRCKWAKRNN